MTADRLLKFSFGEEYLHLFHTVRIPEGKQSWGTGPYLSLLTELPRPALMNADGATLRFEGPLLGVSDMNMDRMAVDEGEVRRPITRLELGLRITEGAYRISFAGKTGRLTRRAQSSALQSRWANRSSVCGFD